MSETNPPAPNTTEQQPSKKARTGLFVGVVIVCALAAALIAALLVSVVRRKVEATNPWVRVVAVNENTTDPAVWAKNWPNQFDSYQRTAESTRTRFGGHGGSEALPEQKIERDPWLKRMFLGYAFSIDYRDRRGHAFMLQDQEQTERVNKKPQSGSCLHCHASITPTYRRVGAQATGQPFDPNSNEFNWPAVMKGFETMARMNYAEAHAELLNTPDGSPNETDLVVGGSSVTEKSPANAEGLPKGAPTTQQALAAHVGEGHPVSCVDCHDPESMQLRVSRPGFVNGIQALANSDDPLPHLPTVEKWRKGDRKKPYDPNADASRQEMRSFVCGQCHVEYYCATKDVLFFPWEKGLKVEQMEAVYDERKFPDGSKFFDYKHAETGAEIYKAQHPEFELWSQGIHARSGVSCADCHMPYQRTGATKVSDHWVRSPLLNINRACQTCHRIPEEEIKARAETIQTRNFNLMQRAGAALMAQLDAITAAKKAGATDEQLREALILQRKAQWRLDYIAAENSMGFHASQEAARILAEAIDYARQGQIAAQQRGGPATRPATVAQQSP
jgi:nitrite reductase (cytochrome c-552)